MSQQHVPPDDQALDGARPGAPDAAGNGAPPRGAEPIPARRVRQPKYSVFIGTGVVLGVLLGVILTLRAGDAAAAYSWQAKLGYLCSIFGLLGGILGAVVVVIIDRPKD